MTTEERTVWTHNGRDLLVRKGPNTYEIPGCTFTMEELKTLCEAFEQALVLEKAMQGVEPVKPPF